MLRGDIDMSDVTLWEGVGTEEHPFTGKFNGDGHAIQNLKKANPDRKRLHPGIAIALIVVLIILWHYLLTGSFRF